MNAATMRTGHPVVDRVFRIAIGDIFGNIQPWQGELDERPRPCIPMKATSTNCLYYNAYRLLPQLQAAVDLEWSEKAVRLKGAINEPLGRDDRWGQRCPDGTVVR